MRTYRCPECGCEIPLADINVAADIMLCKRCGTTSSFAAAASETEDDDSANLLSRQPPKHLRIESDPMDPERRIVITYRRFSPVVFFLIPFTAMWSGLSMTGIYGSQITKGQFDPRLSLFGLPFLLGTVGLVSAILFCLFGRRTLTLCRGEARYFSGVFGIGRHKRFRYDATSKVSDNDKSSYSVNDRTVTSIAVTTRESANKVRIFAIDDADARAYLVQLLRREFRRA